MFGYLNKSSVVVMEFLLEPASTSYKTSKNDHEQALTEINKPPPKQSNPAIQVSAPDEALEILRNKPDLKSLSFVLRYLSHDAASKSGFDVAAPSPLAAQLINVLVSEIVPAYWSILNEEKGPTQKHFAHGAERRLLLSCLRNVAGLSAMSVRMKGLIQSSRETVKSAGGPNAVEILKDLMDVLEAVLNGNDVIWKLYRSLDAEQPHQRKALCGEFLALVGGGKLLNGSAEALSIINEKASDVEEIRWIGSGALYSRWLASNIKHWITNTPEGLKMSWKSVSELFSRSLRLGYPDTIIDELLTLVLGNENERNSLMLLINGLAPSDQRKILSGALNHLSKTYLTSTSTDDSSTWWKSDTELVAGAARYLDILLAKDETRKAFLIDWLTGLSGAAVGEGIGIRRAALAVQSGSKYDLEAILEKSLQQFGDQLYIKHSPTLQQEVHTQVLLLTAGYLHRMAPLKLAMTLRSGVYLNAITNRLSASSDRARILGMIVGEALSSLVEKPEKRMNFKMEELETRDAKWYKSLVLVQDTMGSLDLLKLGSTTKPTTTKSNPPKTKQTARPATKAAQSKIISIEEVDDDDTEDEEDLVPYAKPDSDEEDSDEDPTLVERNKPSAPVYIRDLITYLRDVENYDRQKLALTTAYLLIRRKSNFGTEVTDHAQELATLLVGLQDKYDLENFQNLRLQGMIAVVLSDPSKMGKWFAKTFFGGDYSLSQRLSVLTVLSVSARELAGFKDQEETFKATRLAPPSTFPSKTLPLKLHALYAPEEPKSRGKLLPASSRQPPNQIDTLSVQLSKVLLQPVATSVSSALSGPPILQINQTTLSRPPRVPKPLPAKNAFLPYAASSFFFPLTANFQASSSLPISKNLTLLPPLVKTLTLIYHAAGPMVPELRQMTSEFFDLLLSLRSRVSGDKSMAGALMLGFLTVLEVVDKRMLAEGWGRELGEAERWTQGVLQHTQGGSEEDDKLRAMAAGVLVGIGQVVEGYRALMIGEWDGL